MRRISPVPRYLKRHARVDDPGDGRVLRAPSEKLRLVVVIPAMAERAFIGPVLDSLEVGSERLDEAEVLVVLNRPDDADLSVREDNARTLEFLEARRGPVSVHVLDRSSEGRAFAPRQAGVGRARRLGMDLAIGRLARVGRAGIGAGAESRADEGIIASLDGDSPVAPGYIDALLAAFAARDPRMLAGVCAYRHQVPEDPRLARAIVAYEAWLAYRELAMARAGSPYAFQTLGSCIVTSPTGYALADGMPQKKAGEDFHYLNKVIKAGGPGSVVPLPHVLVHPSPRISTRVPFGTGPAMGRCLAEGIEVYEHVPPPHIYLELAKFFEALGREDARPIAGPTVTRYMNEHKGWDVLARHEAQHKQPDALRWAMHTWFDGLRLLQYGHLGERMHGVQPIAEAMIGLETCG